MSKLEELIQQYCPEGVEWKKLGEFCEIKTGKGITKKDGDDNGAYPIISGGITPMGYFYTYNREGQTVTISRVGANAGLVSFIEKRFYLNDKCFSVIPSINTNTKYLYYILSAKETEIKGMQSEGGVPTINTKKVGGIEIPLPPLPVQEEIVRILDTFTELQAELQAELQKRKEQYNYYRDNLLSFEGRTDVEWKPLYELGELYSGLSGKSKDDFKDGNAKFITYVNIFNHPSLVTEVEEKVKIAVDEKQNTVQYGDVLFTGSSETPDECGMSSVLTHQTDEKLYLNSFCFGFRFFDLSDKYPDFIKHLFRSTSIRKAICKTANGVTRYNVSKKDFAKIIVPIPPITEQQNIASILDKFYTLVGDLTAGLPAEIEKRKQQYEYYRDKLLTFKRKEA